MGPRLVSRGNTKGAKPIRLLIPWLQWGRDSLVAEILQHPDPYRSPNPASMGPRLVSRGNSLSLTR